MGTQRFFQTLLRGKFDPEVDVQLLKPGSSMKTNELAYSWKEGAWQEFIRQGNVPWPGDLEAKRFRLVSITAEAGLVKLVADPCVTYHDFIGTQSPAFAAKFGNDFVSNAIAISVLLRTADNKTLMTQRTKKTDYKWGGWHCSTGGFWEITRKDGTKETPKQAGVRELFEEAGVKEDEIEELVLLGAVNNPWTAHPDLIYSATTSLTSSEVVNRKHDDENSTLFIDTTAQSYDYWMKGAAHASVVVPLAAMLWVGTELFGGEWGKHMLDFLAEESKDYESVKTRIKLEKRDIDNFTKMVDDHRKQLASAA